MMKRIKDSLSRLVVYELWIVLLVPVSDGRETMYVGMDKKTVCRDDNSVNVDYIKETQSALILAKTVGIDKATRSKDCTVILGPDHESRKQFLHMEFESFHMPDCDVELIIYQCPFVTFNRDVIQMVRLGCKHKNPKTLLTKKSHSIRFTLHREHVSMKRQYNFRINVTLTDGHVESQDNLSLGLKIGIVCVSVTVAIIVSIMVFKAVRLRLILHQEYSHESDSDSHHVLTSLSTSRHRLQANSYTHLANHIPTQENQSTNTHLLEQTTTMPAVPRDAERHVYANTPRHVEDPAPPVVGAFPESPPCYDDALHMPLPHGPSKTRSPSPIYQNLHSPDT